VRQSVRFTGSHDSSGRHCFHPDVPGFALRSASNREGRAHTSGVGESWCSTLAVLEAFRWLLGIMLTSDGIAEASRWYGRSMSRILRTAWIDSGGTVLRRHSPATNPAYAGERARPVRQVSEMRAPHMLSQRCSGRSKQASVIGSWVSIAQFEIK
jgi:hypothetical protein